MNIKEIDVKTVLSKSNLPAENLNLRGDYRPVILDWMNYITGFIPRKNVATGLSRISTSRSIQPKKVW